MKHPLPWWVYCGKLRPAFPALIVEVCDANNSAVLPWGAFDHLPTLKDKKALASMIVLAVNRSGGRP